MSEFFILLRRPAPVDNPPDPSKFGELMEAWGGYLGGLGQSGALRATHQLEYEGAVVTSPDGDHTEIDQRVDTVIGWIVVEADSIDAAVDIAKGAPTLAFWPGGTAEVRPVMANPQT